MSDRPRANKHHAAEDFEMKLVHEEVTPTMRAQRILPGMHMERKLRTVDVSGISQEEHAAIDAKTRMEPIAVYAVKREAYERALTELHDDLVEALEGKLDLDDTWIAASLADIREALDNPAIYLGQPKSRR